MSRTTVRLEAELLAEVKAYAAREHTTVNSVMEDALRQLLARARQARDEPARVRLPTDGDGLMPGIDLSPEGLRDALEADDRARFETR